MSSAPADLKMAGPLSGPRQGTEKQCDARTGALDDGSREAAGDNHSPARLALSPTIAMPRISALNPTNQAVRNNTEATYSPHLPHLWKGLRCRITLRAGSLGHLGNINLLGILKPSFDKRRVS